MNRVTTLMLAGILASATAAQASPGCPSCRAPKASVQKTRAATKQKACPVMPRMKVKQDLYVDHEGKRIYVCCEACIDTVKKDFEAYAKKVEAAGETVGTVQTTCPVMGGKINKKQYADVKGKRIYVCCPGCIGKIQADPDTHIEKLEKSGVTLDSVPSTNADSTS